MSPLLSIKEIRSAEKMVLQLIQKVHFDADYERLKNNEELDKKSNLLSLTPFLDNGVMRLRGRIENAQVSYEQKHPVILPSKSIITHLLIEQAHRTLVQVHKPH